ncbi:hypothetical protein [Photobacterium kishitanii]|uniref:Uncharacterized protein n=1 Tax=Photobacterium kishitanii TaxID=318456 RepID=A0A2T3KMG9_9GAMM|nr:hypothetical protein [Photobacterium kishitanii]PSV00974.1 hypothetical protein C9J27_02815 [Photobacterium kishitanii]
MDNENNKWEHADEKACDEFMKEWKQDLDDRKLMQGFSHDSEEHREQIISHFEEIVDKAVAARKVLRNKKLIKEAVPKGLSYLAIGFLAVKGYDLLEMGTHGMFHETLRSTMEAVQNEFSTLGIVNGVKFIMNESGKSLSNMMNWQTAYDDATFINGMMGTAALAAGLSYVKASARVLTNRYLGSPVEGTFSYNTGKGNLKMTMSLDKVVNALMEVGVNMFDSKGSIVSEERLRSDLEAMKYVRPIEQVKLIELWAAFQDVSETSFAYKDKKWAIAALKKSYGGNSAYGDGIDYIIEHEKEVASVLAGVICAAANENAAVALKRSPLSYALGFVPSKIKGVVKLLGLDAKERNSSVISNSHTYSEVMAFARTIGAAQGNVLINPEWISPEGRLQPDGLTADGEKPSVVKSLVDGAAFNLKKAKLNYDTKEERQFDMLREKILKKIDNAQLCEDVEFLKQLPKMFDLIVNDRSHYDNLSKSHSGIEVKTTFKKGGIIRGEVSQLSRFIFERDKATGERVDRVVTSKKYLDFVDRVVSINENIQQERVKKIDKILANVADKRDLIMSGKIKQGRGNSLQNVAEKPVDGLTEDGKFDMLKAAMLNQDIGVSSDSPHEGLATVSDNKPKSADESQEVKDNIIHLKKPLGMRFD